MNNTMSDMMIGFEAPRIILDVMAIMAMIVCGEALYNWLNFFFPLQRQLSPKVSGGSADVKGLTSSRKRRRPPRGPAQVSSFWWLESALGPPSFGMLIWYAYQFHCFTPLFGATILYFCRGVRWTISPMDKEEFFSNISYPTGEVLALGYWNGYLKAFCHERPIYMSNEHVEFHVDVIIVIPYSCIFVEASLLEHGFEEVGSHETCVPGRGFNQRSEIMKKVYKYKTDFGESRFVIVDFPSNLRAGMKEPRMPVEHRKRNIKSFKRKILQLWLDYNVTVAPAPIIIDTIGNPIPEIINQIQQSSVLRSLAVSSSDTDQQ